MKEAETAGPLVNLSLARNQALGGQSIWGYHAVNLLIQILAAWVLSRIMRRTLRRMPAEVPRRGRSPSPKTNSLRR